VRTEQDSLPIRQNKLRDYYDVTKPNVISLLVFVGAASYIASAGRGFNPIVLVLVFASVWLGSAAANTVGSYFDRDIDALMLRTKKRPLPTGRIPSGDALAYGLGLLAASLLLSYFFLSRLSALAMLVGFLDYALVYSLLTKRKSPLNIVLGGFSGVMPVLVGYFAASKPVIPFETALFIGFLVFFWIPEHIWSLAIRYRNDYEKAKIPMLPVVVSERLSVQIIAATTIIMVAYSLLPLGIGGLGLHEIYSIMALALGAAMIGVNLWLLKMPSTQRAWTVFKISSPYLFFIFVGIVADILVSHH
jgi:protoheme IX farnesyltransferase